MKKKKNNKVVIVLLGLFLVYISLFITQQTGYYEVINHNKAKMTEENMKKFESDVKNGKNITLTDYLDEDKDYTSSVGNIGYETSEFIEMVMSKGLKRTGVFLARLLS